MSESCEVPQLNSRRSLTDDHSKEILQNYKTYAHKTPFIIYKMSFRKGSILRAERSQVGLLDIINSSLF